MKRRRRNSQKEADNAVPNEIIPQEEPPAAPSAPAAPAERPARLAAMASVARKRAAHFANYQADFDEEDNIHTGGQEARSLGMWASSYQLMEGRSSAAAARQEKLLAAEKAAAAAKKALEWKPARDVRLGPHKRERVPSLMSLTANLLAEYLEDVESLWGIDDPIRVQMARAAGELRKLSPAAVRLFTAHAPQMVVLPDCTQMEQAELAHALTEAANPNLTRLELGLCGRGLGDVVAKSVAGQGQLQRLEVLALGGAYRLTDEGVQALLAQAPALEELLLRDCCRLQGDFLASLPTACPKLRRLDLSECRGLDGDALLKALAGGMPNLEALLLDGILDIKDDWLEKAAPHLSKLRHLSISLCPAVTDRGVAAIAAACPKLATLHANGLARLTDAALVVLADSCPDLQEVSVKECKQVGDSGVIALAQGRRLRKLNLGRVPGVGPGAIQALASCCASTLEDVDLSWNHGLPADAFGLLADSCHQLSRLTVFGCSQVDGRILFGHSNERLEFVGAACLNRPPLPWAKAAFLV